MISETMLKLICIAWLAWLLGLIQISLVPLLPFPFAVLNPVLITVILLIFFFDFNLALAVSLIGGLILEFFSAAPFGLLTSALVLTAFGVNILALIIFTNRSLPALLIIGLLGHLIYKIVFLIIYLLASVKIKTLPLPSFKDYLGLTSLEILMGTAFFCLAYLIIYQSTKKFDERFLSS